MTTTSFAGSKRPAWVSRILWALLGGLGAIIVGVTVNLVSASLTASTEIPTPTKTSVNCEDPLVPKAEEGEELLVVLLRGPYRECWNQVIDTARPGDKFTMRISYQNNTSVQQQNVILRAILPEGFEYVERSTYFASSSTDGKYKRTIDGIVATGLNVGGYEPRGNCFYKLDIRMTDSLAPLSGTQVWNLTAKATTAHSSVYAYGAVVTVRPPKAG